MKLFFDTEFTGLRKYTTLISIGIVSEDGRKFYAELTDYNENQCNKWINENVVKNLHLPHIPWHSKCTENIKKLEEDGYVISQNPHIPREGALLEYDYFKSDNENMTALGDSHWIGIALNEWLKQFDTIQFVSDVCHYDFVLLIELITNGGTALGLPGNISAVCHDINHDIASFFHVSDMEAFNMSREEIVEEFREIDGVLEGNKHNSLYDAEVIKVIWEQIIKKGKKEVRI